MTKTTPITKLSDDDLLRLAVAGDENAFLCIYHRRQSAIYRFAQHMSGSETVAEEVTQEVFLTLLRNPGAYDSRLGTLSAYLFGVARNQVRKHFGTQQNHVELDDDSDDVTSGPEAGILAGLTRTETVMAVRQAVASLPESYREAVVLCDLQEMSYQEAAECLRVPMGTVRSRLNRGRALLVKKLSPNRMRCIV